MAEANEKNVDTTTATHDRVVMLSLRADGTPDQINPEIIGDKEVAKEAAKRQFAEQAVSSADDAKRKADAASGVEHVEQDPTIAAAQAEHEKIAAAAEKAATATIDKLHK